MRVPQHIITFSLIILFRILPADSYSDPVPDICRDSHGNLSGNVYKAPPENRDLVDSINIGLLVQNNKSTAARQAAELAISIANQKRGADETRFRLIVRSMEGPWGTGSRQAVSLVFDEHVAALLGSHDGRNAHLVEQVAAKSRIVFISAWSGDPTLSQAFVPWFFNSTFNYNQQANSLYGEICINKRLEKIAVVSDDSYDSGSMLKCFLEQLKNNGKATPVQFVYNRTGNDIKGVINNLKGEDFDCLVLFARPPASLNIIWQLRVQNLQQPVYCSMIQLDDDELSGCDVMPYENVTFVSRINFSGKPGISFREEYRKKFGTYPGVVAACAFDGMNLLIEAIRKAGTDREKLEEELKEIRYEGVTGLIQFDDKGNRMGTPELVVVKNGIPVQME